MTQKEKKRSAAIDFHIQGGNLEDLFSEILKFRERAYCAVPKAEWESNNERLDANVCQYSPYFGKMRSRYPIGCQRHRESSELFHESNHW